MKGIKLVPNKPLTELQKLKVDNTMLRQEVANLKKQLKLYGVSQQRELLIGFMSFMYKDHWEKVKPKIEKQIDEYLKVN